VGGDSAFASVKTAKQMKAHGMHFFGVVKTATTEFPLKYLREHKYSQEKNYVALEAQDGLIALGWTYGDKVLKKQKVQSFISTFGTTLEGKVISKKRHRLVGDDEEEVSVEVKCPRLIEDYFSAAPVIDIHNHLRQHGLALEEVWGTHTYWHRILAALIGMTETDTYLAATTFLPQFADLDHTRSTAQLALELIRNDFGVTTPLQTRSKTVAQPGPTQPIVASVSQEVCALAPLTDIVSPSKKKERRQRKCVICKRVRNKFTKTSSYCKGCYVNYNRVEPLCGSKSDCFAYHVQHGTPPKKSQ
jgi:hypothetical protein